MLERVHSFIFHYLKNTTMKKNVKLDFIALPVPEKVAEGEAISANFKEQIADYPSPDVPLSDFDTHLTALSTAYKKALNKGTDEKFILAQSEEVVNEDYRLLALYAHRVTKGDEEKLIKLGFRIVKPRVFNHHKVLKVLAGEHSGSVLVKYYKIKGAVSYLFQISTDGKNWTLYGVFTTCKIIITGLTPDTRYYFRVASVSSSGTTEYSPLVSKMVE